jgi:cyanophycinase-like exopeptidase
MDTALLAAAGGGPVVVVALAAAPGREYDTATANGVRHFTGLGAAAEGAPDARDDPGGALAALAAVARAGLLVLPGGSPARLLGALAETGMGAAIRRRALAGGSVMGASAGAMAVCECCVVPGRRPSVAAGLGLVPRCLVIPHFRGRSDWAEVAPSGITVLGLPECAGLFVDAGTATAVGVAPATVGGRAVPVGTSVDLP